MGQEVAYTIRPVADGDRSWIAQQVTELWGSPIIVAHGIVYEPANLPGFIAIQQGQPVGLVTYSIQGRACEILSLHSLKPAAGIGSALIDAVKTVALQASCKRLWLITTNDNLHALGFYQKRGFELVAIHRNAVMESRRIKPQISLLGDNDIPLRDEIELEMPLEGERNP